MSRHLGLSLLLLIGAVVADDADPEPIAPPAAELKKLQGIWQLTKAVREGMDETAAKKGSTFTFAKDKLDVLEGGNRAEACTVTLDPKKKPPHIDIKVPNDAQLIKGIYKLTKDDLTIAFNEPGQERPKGFEDKNLRGLLVLKRQKAK